MSYSITTLQDDCYPGTSIMINKFGIKDARKLEEVESVLSSGRAEEWLKKPLSNSFDFNHYKAIHKYLFGDIYDWAGKVRAVDTSKQGTNFCKASEIEKIAIKVFERIKLMNKNNFKEELLDFYISSNMLHPFREGNGRTQRLFIVELAHKFGYDIDFSKIDKDILIIATIQSANGVNDLLKSVFEELM